MQSFSHNIQILRSPSVCESKLDSGIFSDAGRVAGHQAGTSGVDRVLDRLDQLDRRIKAVSEGDRGVGKDGVEIRSDNQSGQVKVIDIHAVEKNVIEKLEMLDKKLSTFKLSSIGEKKKFHSMEDKFKYSSMYDNFEEDCMDVLDTKQMILKKITMLMNYKTHDQ